MVCDHEPSDFCSEIHQSRLDWGQLLVHQSFVGLLVLDGAFVLCHQTLQHLRAATQCPLCTPQTKSTHLLEEFLRDFCFGFASIPLRLPLPTRTTSLSCLPHHPHPNNKCRGTCHLPLPLFCTCSYHGESRSSYTGQRLSPHHEHPYQSKSYARLPQVRFLWHLYCLSSLKLLLPCLSKANHLIFYFLTKTSLSVLAQSLPHYQDF